MSKVQSGRSGGFNKKYDEGASIRQSMRKGWCNAEYEEVSL